MLGLIGALVLVVQAGVLQVLALSVIQLTRETVMIKQLARALRATGASHLEAVVAGAVIMPARLMNAVIQTFLFAILSQLALVLAPSGVQVLAARVAGAVIRVVGAEGAIITRAVLQTRLIAMTNLLVRLLGRNGASQVAEGAAGALFLALFVPRVLSGTVILNQPALVLVETGAKVDRLVQVIIAVLQPALFVPKTLHGTVIPSQHALVQVVNGALVRVGQAGVLLLAQNAMQQSHGIVIPSQHALVLAASGASQVHPILAGDMGNIVLILARCAQRNLPRIVTLSLPVKVPRHFGAKAWVAMAGVL